MVSPIFLDEGICNLYVQTHIMKNLTRRYQFEIYPSPVQEKYLAKIFGSVRFVYNEFLKYDLADEVNIFTAPKVMGKGIKGFNDRKLFERFKNVSYSSSGTDMLVNLRR